jgi:hypothetical protein
MIVQVQNITGCFSEMPASNEVWINTSQLATMERVSQENFEDHWILKFGSYVTVTISYEQGMDILQYMRREK